MIRYGFAAAALALLAAPLTAQVVDSDTTYSCDAGIGQPDPFAISCREEAPGFEMRGPEFDEERYLATWLKYLEPTDDNQGLIYIADVDPVTGVIDALNAEAILYNVAPPRATNNGPEWADSQRGAEVFFSCTNADKTRSKLCRINPDFTVTELKGTVGYSIRSAAKNGANANPKVYFEARSDTFDDGQYIRKGFGYREDVDPAVDTPVDPSGNVKGGRWLPDGNTIVYSKYQYDLVRQKVVIELYGLDTNSGLRKKIFNDGRSRINARAWVAPELNGKLAFTVITLDDTNPDAWDLEVYRQTTGPNFELWQVLEPICPTTFPNAASPEPFVINGISYVTGVSVPAVDLDQDPGVIWVVTADPNLPAEDQVRRLVSNTTCDNDGVIRKDPEALVLQDESGNPVGARIYYTIRALE